MEIGAQGSIVVKVCNDPSINMIRLTPDVTEAIFNGTESSSSRGQARSAHSTRIGLPSARKVMNAVGGSIELYQDEVNTVTCRIEFPTTGTWHVHVRICWLVAGGVRCVWVWG